MIWFWMVIKIKVTKIFLLSYRNSSRYQATVGEDSRLLFDRGDIVYSQVEER
jgi:hypothetical protein